MLQVAGEVRLLSITLIDVTRNDDIGVSDTHLTRDCFRRRRDRYDGRSNRWRWRWCYRSWARDSRGGLDLNDFTRCGCQSGSLSHHEGLRRRGWAALKVCGRWRADLLDGGRRYYNGGLLGRGDHGRYGH
jgi:hypothetical protein